MFTLTALILIDENPAVDEDIPRSIVKHLRLIGPTNAQLRYIMRRPEALASPYLLINRWYILRRDLEAALRPFTMTLRPLTLVRDLPSHKALGARGGHV